MALSIAGEMRFCRVLPYDPGASTDHASEEMTDTFDLSRALHARFDPQPGVTAKRLRDVPAVSCDPLKGAQILYAADDRMEDARRLADTIELRSPPLVLSNRNLPPQFIVGMMGSRIVLVLESRTARERFDK
jgi:hypothetical protein